MSTVEEHAKPKRKDEILFSGPTVFHITFQEQLLNMEK